MLVSEQTSLKQASLLVGRKINIEPHRFVSPLSNSPACKMWAHEARTVISSVKLLRNKRKMNKPMHKRVSKVCVKGNFCFLIPAPNNPFISCKHSPAPTTLNLYFFVFILPCAQNQENINVTCPFAGVFPVKRQFLAYFLFYFLYLDTCLFFNSFLRIDSFFQGCNRLLKNLHHEKMPLDMTYTTVFDSWI